MLLGDRLFGAWFDQFDNFVQYQTMVLAEFRRLADHHGFTVIDASQSVGEVFEQLVVEVQDVIQDM